MVKVSTFAPQGSFSGRASDRKVVGMTRRYRLSWPVVVLICAFFSALIALHVSSPQLWLVAFMVVPLAVAPVRSL